MPRRGENIYKRKDGRWEGRYISERSENGKAVYKSVYACNYCDVREKLRQQRSFAPKPEDDKALSYYAEHWLNTIKMSRKISTYNKYKNAYMLHIEPLLGNCRPDTINSFHIEKVIKACENLSPKSVNEILLVMKMILEFARQNNCPVNISMKGYNLRQKYPDIRVLSTDEQQKLVSVLMCNTDLRKMGVYLSLCTGIRIGELCALRRENIAFETGLLLIRGTMQRVQIENSEKKTKVIICEPKSSKSVRDIPLPFFLIELCKKNYGNMKPHDFLLTGSEKFMEPRSLQYHFKKYIKESEIEDANFHALRHTFATRCIENGFDIKTLSEILGHVNVNITLNRYVHSSLDLKRMNMDKLSCVF